MRKFLSYSSVIVMVVVSIILLRAWCRHDTEWLKSFDTLTALQSSELSKSLVQKAFSQSGCKYVAVKYDVKKLPACCIFRWHPLAEPYLIFGEDGKRVDYSRNYNDDHLFAHRWPSLFINVTDCRCGWKHSDTDK